MTYLLDTNACIELLRKRSVNVRMRIDQEQARGAAIATSSVVMFELWFGTCKSKHRIEQQKGLAAFLAGPIDVLDFDHEDAQVAGEVRAQLERRGMSIGAYDVLIAGQSLRRGTTLVTANIREFERVAGLQWEDWAG